MAKYEFVKQDGQMDCGVSCLLMIIRYYKGASSKEYLRGITNTTKNGTRAYDLLKAGEKFSFQTFGLKGDLKDLEKKYLPVIAHVISDNYYHFIVIYEIDFKKNKMIIADPASGIKKIKIDEFLKVSTNQYLVFVQNGKILKIHPTKRMQKLIIKFIKTHSLIIIIVILLSFLYTLFSIASSFYFETLLEAINNNFKLSIFIFITLIFLLISIGRIISKFFRMLLFSLVLSKLDLYLFKNLYHHLFSLPNSYYQSRSIGEVTSRINDLSKIDSTLGNFFFSIIIDFLLLIILIVLLFYLEPLLTIMILIFVILEFIIFFLFKKRLKSKIVLVKEKYEKSMSKILDTLNNISSIRFSQTEKYIEEKVFLEYENSLKSLFNYQKSVHLNSSFLNLIRTISEILVFFFGIILINKGYITLSSFFSYYFLLSFFFEPINNFFTFIYEYMDSKESIFRIEELYEVEEERREEKLSFSVKKIKLQDISYSYLKDSYIFKNWTGEFKRGDRILLYGNSGCGKSTLSRILAGFEENYQGDILVNDNLILNKNISSLRHHTSYIKENSGLLNMSIRENILLGRNIDNDTLKKVLNICKVEEILEKHPLGLDMMVEEGGTNFSAGERQRIILARSIVASKDIYILDESLSNVDIKKERQILEELFIYLKDKIVIVISHRLNNEDLYNRKINFLKGEVV